MGFLDFLKRKSQSVSYENIGNYHQYLHEGMQLGSNVPFLIDITNGKIRHLFRENPYLQLVINTRANFLSALKWEHYNGDDLVEDSSYVKLLDNPNPLESGQEFIKKLSINYDLYGASILYAPKPTLENIAPKLIHVLPSERIEVIPTGKLYEQDTIDGIIKTYRYLKFSDDKDKDFESKDIIYIKDNCLVNPIKPESKITSLRYQLSNIKCAMESRNVLIKDRGARGILSLDNKTTIPMNPEEKIKLEKKLGDKYGLKQGQKSIMLSTAPVKWTQITENVKSLMLFEEINDDFMTIIDSYGLNINIFSRDNGQTFENYKESLKGIYQNTIIPHANNIAQKLNNYFELPEGEYLKATFDIPSLKKDENLEAQAFQSKANAINNLKDILPEEDFKKLYEKVLNL